MQVFLSILEVFFLSIQNVSNSVDPSGFFSDLSEKIGFSSFDFTPLQNLTHVFTSISSDSIVSAPILLLVAGAVIFFGVIGEAFFKKTGIPDVAFLMILGIIVGPVLGLIHTEVVLQVVPYFAALALIIIMYDGGLNLDLKSIASTAHFAIILSVLGFAVSVGIVAAFAHYGLGWGWIEGILLGSIVGGSSSAIVFGLVRNLKISDGAKSLLSFESALTDILATVIAFVLFGAVLSGTLDISFMGSTIENALVVGLILGLGVGIPWMYVTTKLSSSKHSYMLTLAILFILYFLANYFGESGALTALVFGLMLGNKRRLAKYLRFPLPKIDTDDPTHNQITFLVRTFFFVFVGLLASFGNIEFIIFGISVTIAIYFSRTVIVKILLTKRFSHLDKKVTSIMIPRGLAAAVLATFPLTLGLPNATAYSQIVFSVIMASVIITTLGLGSAKKIPPPEPTSGGYVVSEASNQ
jgi:cell volume regulation protein A